MPTPRPNETEEEYVSRCIPIVTKEGTAKNEKQAAAICYSMYKKKNEDILKKIDDYILESEEMVCEIKYKKVIRKGKIVKKPVCPKGYKVVSGKCVKMSAGEMVKRSRSTKRAQKKIQNSGAKAKLIRSRAKSMKKRKAIIPSAQPFPKVTDKGVK